MAVAAQRHPLVHRLSVNLWERCGVERGSKIVLGVSGGADSLALALACGVLAERGEVEPVVAHVHHHLRAEADDDAAHVESFCRRFRLPFVLRHVYPGNEAGNVSDRARRARYAALVAAAKQSGAAAIAVAHHADDQFETILMALCRGSDAALEGMRWFRALEEIDPSIALVRPFLDAARAECESLCIAAEVAWRDDPSNADPKRARARVRSEVVPVLESLWPGAARRAVMTMQSLAEARHVSEIILDDKFGPPSQREWSRDAIRALPISVLCAGLRRAVVDALSGSGCDDLNRDHFERVALAIRDDERQPRTFQFPRGLRCMVPAAEITLRFEERET